MHIEPGVVSLEKIALSYVTAAAAFGLTAAMARQSLRDNGGALALLVRSVITTALVFSFFEVFPHEPVGVSEVHLILGSTLLLTALLLGNCHAAPVLRPLNVPTREVAQLFLT